MRETYSSAVQVARDYYNSADADTFYASVWGGEDLHLGIYESETESIFEASRRTIRRMAAHCSRLDSAARVLDLGAGYGGTARYLARTYGCRVTALNLSEKENERDRQLTAEQGLEHLVEVVDGSFQELPFAAETFDVVWSQDALLHSDHRAGVLREAHRVLRSGGELVFTDPMQADGCPAEVLAPILERLQLESLGSPAFYRDTARALGMMLLAAEDQTRNLTRHYRRVLEETELRYRELVATISPRYLDRMRAGLRRWIEGGEQGYLAWAIFCFRKP